MYTTNNSWLFEHFCWLLDHIEEAVGLAPVKPTPMMDTKTLRVGQNVFLRSGESGGCGKRSSLCCDPSLQDRKTAMDTKTLVVGQNVYMLKPPYPFWFCIDEGKVVKVTPEGVDVQTVEETLRFDTNNIPVFIVGQTTLVVGQDVDVAYCQRKDKRGKVLRVTPSGVEVQVADLIQFDTNGKERDASRRDRLGFGPSPDDNFYTFLWQSAPEFGPWHLDEMPFEERTAKIEHHQRLLKSIKALAVDQEVWMVCGLNIKGECFIKGKVVKISSDVEVLELPWGDRKGGELRRFCFDGTQHDGNHHPEFGPWRLDDIPFAERTALLERT